MEPFSKSKASTQCPPLDSSGSDNKDSVTWVSRIEKLSDTQ
jgi:hypothetical protein